MKKATDKNPTRCKRCGRKPGKDPVDGYCSKDCRITDLEGKLEESNSRLDGVKRRGPEDIECLARIDWEWCSQEWYLKETFDAKRRCCQLRHLGFKCSAKSVGAMPIETVAGVKMRKVTILTAIFFENESGDIAVPPDPPKIIDGLKAENN